MYEYLELTVALLFGLCIGVILGIAFMQIKMSMPETEKPSVDHFADWRVTEPAKSERVDVVVIARRIEAKQ